MNLAKRHRNTIFYRPNRFQKYFLKHPNPALGSVFMATITVFYFKSFNTVLFFYAKCV